MYKEAAIVLENTFEPNGALAEAQLYLRCLIRSGQVAKAARAAASLVALGASPTSDARRRLEDAAAALALLQPTAFADGLAGAASADAHRWTDMTAAAQAAIAAFTSGMDAAMLDGLMAKIPLRSPFGPVRTIVRSLALLTEDRTKARRLIEAIAQDSTFFPFRAAIEQVLSSDDLPLIATGSKLSPAGRTLAVELLGLSGPALQTLTRLVEAERGGAAALFTLLQKSRDLPTAEVRSACLNLLPQLPDKLHAFDKAFAPLTPFEKARIQALAAESRGDWAAAETAWRRAIEALAAEKDGSAKRAEGVIFRHLSDLAHKHREIEGPQGDSENASLHYLERSVAADPDRLATTLALIDLRRAAGDVKAWGQEAEGAAERFPTESRVLQQAMEATAARNALKLAAGFGRRILALDPINQKARRSMIELALGHARKQIKSKRPDLAAKQLAEAAQWERADRPSPDLRIAQGIVGLLSNDDRAAAEALVRDGVALAGGGVAAWLQAALEALTMQLAPGRRGFITRELKAARARPGSKEEVVASVTILGAAVKDKPQRIPKDLSALFDDVRRWLAEAASLTWSTDEFLVLADVFERFKAFPLIALYAGAGVARQPQDPIFRFYRIIGRCQGDIFKLTEDDQMQVEGLIDEALERGDMRFAGRARRFFENAVGPIVAPDGLDLSPDEFGGPDADFVKMFVSTMYQDIDQPIAQYLSRLAKSGGRQAAMKDALRRFRKSPVAGIFEEEMMRQIFEVMIDAAMQSPV
jgi:hypothetical protein